MGIESNYLSLLKQLGEERRLSDKRTRELYYNLAASAWNIKKFGAKLDDSTNDTNSFISALDSGESLLIPPGTARLESPLDIENSMTLFGIDRNTCRLKFYGCDGITVKSDQVAIKNLILEEQGTGAVKTALKLDKDNDAKRAHIVLDDLFFWKWNLGLHLYYTWNSQFSKLTTLGGNSAVLIEGQSVNNFFNLFDLQGEATSPAANSYIVKIIGVDSDTPESCNFETGLIYGGESGIIVTDAAWCKFIGAVVDMPTKYGVIVNGGISGFDFSHGYIGLQGLVNNGIGIAIADAASLAIGGNLCDNHIYEYSSTLTTVGIYIGSNNKSSKIHANFTRGFTSKDIHLVAGSGLNSVLGNHYDGQILDEGAGNDVAHNIQY